MKNKHFISLLLATALCTCATAQTVMPDTGFGNNGTFKQDVNNEYAYAQHAIIQPDGKLLFSITSDDEFSYNTSQWLYRLNKNGTADSSFGNYGMVRLGKPNYRQGVVAGGYFDLQRDGKIVTANRAIDRMDEYPSRIVVERFMPDGTPDSSFGIKRDGSFSFENFDLYFTYVSGIKIRPNGRILLFGGIGSSTGYVSVLLQLLPNGRIDRSFGDSGVLQSNSPYEKNIRAVLPLPNNQFITACLYVKADKTIGSCLVMHKADGTIDSSRGTNGVVENNNLVERGTDPFYANASVGLQLQANNKLLEYTVDYHGNTLMGLLLRYNRDGTPDKSFGNNGRVITGALGTSYNPSYPNIVETQANGRILVNGRQQLQRYFTNGTADTTFGTNGILTQPDLPESQIFAVNASRLYIVGTGYNEQSGAPAIVNAYQFCNNCTAEKNRFITQLKAPAKGADLIKLFPNPVRDKLTITGLSTAAPATLQLRDVTGRLIQSATTQQAIFQWSVQSLARGTYYVDIITGKAPLFTYKIVKE